jgi:hypothetical protein
VYLRDLQRFFISRRVIVWIAAYALVLQTVLAPLLATPKQMGGTDGVQLFALCLSGHAAVSPASTDIPVGNNDLDIHCKLCVQGEPTFAGTPNLGTGWTAATTSTLLRWGVTDNPVAVLADLIGEHARGPPLLI